jgi:hypothetical protein
MKTVEQVKRKQVVVVKPWRDYQYCAKKMNKHEAELDTPMGKYRTQWPGTRNHSLTKDVWWVISKIGIYCRDYELYSTVCSD